MSSRALYVLIGTLVFVFSFILLTPAATLYGWVKPRLGSNVRVELAGVGGTAREGTAAAVLVDGRPLAEKLHWRLSLGELLLARVGADLDSRGATMLDGHISKGFNTLRARDLRVVAPARALLGAAGQPFAPIDGIVNLDVTQLKLLGNWPTDAAGTLRLQGLAWTLAKDPVPFGDYEVTFSRDGTDIVALVHTIGGPLDVNGDARAKADHSWELHLQMRPKADAPPLLPNLLRSLGEPDPQGYYHLRKQGKVE